MATGRRRVPRDFGLCDPVLSLLRPASARTRVGLGFFLIENADAKRLGRQCAETAAIALTEKLRATRGDVDPAGLADIIEQVLNAAAREQEEAEHQRLGEVQANAWERLTQLLNASPAVIYSFKASGNFAPTFVSASIERLFGYAPCEYLDNPNFWRERVHPNDLQRAEAEITDLFKNGKHALEYRFRRKDDSYCWVNDEQYLIRDEKGEPVEIVGSWSDITARKQAEEAEDAATADASPPCSKARRP